MVFKGHKEPIVERCGLSIAEDFLFAGSSALVPFLYKISRAPPCEGFRLGFLFGISFFTVSLYTPFAASPFLPLIKILIGTFLFSFFGWLTAWTRERWGFNPIIIALLWLIMELVMMKIGYATGISQQALLRHSALNNFAALFGLLFISFVIVLLNSVLIWVVENTAFIASTSWQDTETRKQESQHIDNLSYRLQEVFSIPQKRAPPLFQVLTI